MNFLTAMMSILTALTLTAAAHASDKPATEKTACEFSSTARFIESAPRDRFSFQNTSTADWSISMVNLDLTTSAGKLIFDVTADGAGVEVFQPFRAEPGEAMLNKVPRVDDGDQIIILEFSAFNPNEQYQFSIDVDDQLTQSELGQIRVSGGEMAGATITLGIMNGNGEERTVSGVFDKTNQVSLGSEDC